jgi:hypothetical protein
MEVVMDDDSDSAEVWKARSQEMLPPWAEMFRENGVIFF